MATKVHISARPKVVFHADDLGLSVSFNEGILEAATRGLLTSTCIRVNGAAYRDAIDRVIPAIRHVSVGLHLNLVEGRSSRLAIGSSEILCHPDGSYRLGFIGLLLRQFNSTLLAEIETDFRNQIELAIMDLGNIDHINSHQHSHVIPSIFELTCRLAVEYGIPVVRAPRERFYFAGPFWQHLRPWYLMNLAKWTIITFLAAIDARIAERFGVKVPNNFVGVLYTGFMDAEKVLGGIRRMAKPGTLLEVLLHPVRNCGLRDEVFLDTGVRDYVWDPARRLELSVLTSTVLQNVVSSSNWELTNLRRVPTLFPKAFVAAKTDHRRFRTIVVFDETPFYQPSYFQRLLTDCVDIEIVAAAIVVLPRGGKLQSYLLKNWRELGAVQLVRLGLKSVLLRMLDRLPRYIRGDFVGSVRRLASEYALPHRIVDRVNTDDFRNWVRSYSPDLIISSNSCIFGEELIKIPSVACINRHSALLPSYGGILPVFRSVQFGESHTGASIHYMVKGIDEGAVLSRKAFPIALNDSLDHLYKLCFIASYEATVEAITRLKADSKAESISADGINPSYFSFPTPADWEVFRSKGIPFIR